MKLHELLFFCLPRLERIVDAEKKREETLSSEEVMDELRAKIPAKQMDPQQHTQPSVLLQSSTKNSSPIPNKKCDLNTKSEFASSSMNKYKYQKRTGKKECKSSTKGFQISIR